LASVCANLDAQRDPEYANDYVEAMWLMLQHSRPGDYVVATVPTISVREFCRIAFHHVGLEHEDFVARRNDLVRPSEVDLPLGDADIARRRRRLAA
jgi:GDPmannose 4,6-dehydratase